MEMCSCCCCSLSFELGKMLIRWNSMLEFLLLGATLTTVFAIGTSLRRLGILPLADEGNIDVPCRKIPERTKVTDVPLNIALGPM